MNTWACVSPRTPGETRRPKAHAFVGWQGAYPHPGIRSERAVAVAALNTMPIFELAVFSFTMAVLLIDAATWA